MPGPRGPGTGQMMQTLEFLGLTKRYGAAPALDDVSLTLRAGEVHALMGENGAGKSTLIKLIAGVVPADRMEIRVDGAPVPLRSAADAARAGFRIIHQELHVVPQLSVAENVLLGHPMPRRLGAFVDWRRLEERARTALAALGAVHVDVRAQAGDLSVGDRMLTRIASALVADEGASPCLYVLDEPTAALTARESERLFGVIGRLKAQGAAILYVSHRMDEVLRLADAVTVLRDGRRVLTTRLAQTSRAGIIAAMTGRDVAVDIPPRRAPAGSATVLRAEAVAAEGLSDIGFTLRAGEVLGVAGLEDQGQTALLRLLLGQNRLRSGRLTVLGSPPPRRPAEAWARGLAYVPRERRTEALMPGMGVRPNMLAPHIAAAGWIARRPREAARTRALAGAVGLRYRDPEQPVAELSGGNQQKVVLARALAGTPRLLLLEEPTRGVDVGARADLHALVRDASAGGCAVILASSDLPELIGLADRILILRAGRQVALIPAAGLSPAALLDLIYAPVPA